MKTFRWNAAKNKRLQRERGVSFEEIVIAIGEGGLLDVLEHRNPSRYPRQKLLVVALRQYAYLVPYIEEADGYFLKTIIPSRKAPAITCGVRDTEEDAMGKTTATRKTAEESRLLQAFQSGDFRPVRSRSLRVRQLKQAARATVKDRRLNIRLSAPVLEGLRARAAEEGLPYQTLIASVLHRFVTGRLIDRGSKA